MKKKKSHNVSKSIRKILEKSKARHEERELARENARKERELVAIARAKTAILNAIYESAERGEPELTVSMIPHNPMAYSVEYVESLGFRASHSEKHVRIYLEDDPA